MPLLLDPEHKLRSVVGAQGDESVSEPPRAGKTSHGHDAGAAGAVILLMVTLAAVGVATAQTAQARPSLG